MCRWRDDKIYKRGENALEQKGATDMERDGRLIRLYTRVYSRDRNVRLLKVIGTVGVGYVAVTYAALCIMALLDGGALALVRLLCMAAIPFVLVSVLRLVLDCARPYETVDLAQFEKMRAERKTGRSFPSRHVFSAFLIGTLAMAYSPTLGVLTLLVGAYIGAERSLLGIHYPKDVVAGAIIGAISGTVGILFL